MVIDAEIKDGLWALKAFKAPGPNGLHARFIQRFWLTVGDLVKTEVKKAFKECKIPEYLNRTNVVLIPKIAGPESLGNYRPISLCNTVYKTITKILVARIRPYLDKLVSPLQSAFVLGRRCVDNAIVVQEIIHTLSMKKGRVGYMAIKVDLEKAYDKTEWSFIREVLINANLPHNLISLIMRCVSSVSTSILFNGGNMEPILPSRGIRQGDPLSPNLFIFCMEVLDHLIEEKCRDNQWNLVKSSNNGVAISHLFFADDLVLFAKANHGNCSTIRDVLDSFCARSGQSISESNQGFIFLRMLMWILGDPCVIFLDFVQPRTLEIILDFPLSTMEEEMRILTSFWRGLSKN